MNLKLLNDQQVPPGGFVFIVPETGFKIGRELSIEDLYSKIEKHYRDNRIHLPANWKERVQNQICQKLPPNWCSFDGANPNPQYKTDLSADRILKGLSSLTAMAKAAIKGEEVFVDQNEAEKRAEICARCHLNMSSNFCAGCAAGQAIRNLVSGVKGNRTTTYDDRLMVCGVCGCKNEVIVHVNRNLLLTGEKSETTDSRPNWCWVKNPNTSNAKELLKI